MIMNSTHLLFTVVILGPAMLFVSIIWLVARRQLRLHRKMLNKLSQLALSQTLVDRERREHTGIEPTSHTDEESAASVMDHIVERSSGTRP